MLDAFIIEELRRREQAERSIGEQPRLERPLEERREPDAPTSERPASVPRPRGPVVIEY